MRVSCTKCGVTVEFFFYQTAHVKPTWYISPPDKGVQRERVGTDNLFGFLPQGNPVGEVPVTGLPRGSTQCRKSAGTFHVRTFLVSDSGGPVGKGTAAPLQLVWDAHTSRADHQEYLDGTMRSEYADEVAEKGYGDRGKVIGGNLQSTGGGRSGLF